MNVINKHIFKIQFIAIAVTFLALGLIDFVLAALNELNYRTNESYTASIAMQYVALNTPARLYLYSPYIVLVGVLFATGQMANDRELVIYESASLTKKQIVNKILLAPIVWLCLFFIMGETIAPFYEIKAKETRDLAASKTSTQYGVWHKEGDSFYYFRSIDQDGHISGGYRITPNNAEQTATVETFEALVPITKGQWQVSSVSERTLGGSTNAETIQSSSLQWPLQASPELLLMETNTNLNLSISKLKQYNDYLKQQALNNKHYSLKLWQKVSQPFISLALVWLGITFIFGPLRQATMGTRIFTGVMVSLVLNIVQSVLSPLSITFSVPTAIIALAPLLIIILLNLWLLRTKQV